MRVPSTSQRRAMRMDLTPLIDTVFNLVIFFLVASHFSNETDVAVELPKASSSEDDDEDPLRLVITITEDETLRVKNRVLERHELLELAQEEFERSGPEMVVQIRSDRRVPYRAIEPILVACSRLGITRFGFNTASN